MLGGSRSRVAKLGLNLGNFISVLFFFLSFSLSICSSRINSLVRSTFLFRSSYLFPNVFIVFSISVMTSKNLERLLLIKSKFSSQAFLLKASLSSSS